MEILVLETLTDQSDGHKGFSDGNILDMVCSSFLSESGGEALEMKLNPGRITNDFSILENR